MTTFRWCRLTPRVLSGESTVITVSTHAERLQGNFGGGRDVVVVASVRRGQMSGKRAECVGAMVGVGPRAPLSVLCRTRPCVRSDGLEKVLFVLTGGPDKVPLKKNS